jgi:two-component system sensor kinase FixL
LGDEGTIANAVGSLKGKTHRKTSCITSPLDSSQNMLKELDLSSEQFQVLFGDSLLGVLFCKVLHKGDIPFDLLVLDVNPAFCQVLNLKRENILNKKYSHFSLFYSEDFLHSYGQVALNRIPEIREIYFSARNKWYQTYTYSPKKEYLIIMLTEISERKKTEQQLLISEKKYRQLYETTRDGIMARDLQGKMIDCNRAYAKMLGYTKKELKQLSVHQLLPEKWYAQRDAIVAKVTHTGKSIVFEREYIRKDGTIFPCSVRTWRLTDDKGKVMGTWSLVRDISAQKQLQNELQKHAETLEKVVADRTKQLKDSERLVAIGQTAGMVGHDLRNPLQTITGELYLAKDSVESLANCDLKESLQESIRAIEEQAVYMDKIVSDLQDFVKPIKIDKNQTDLRKLVQDVLETIAFPEHIKVQIRFTRNFPMVKVDIQLLKRVLINLVTNAVQSMSKEGKITIHAQIINDDLVSVSVQDQGVGISDVIKSQIFTPLFTTKPRGQGFGLAVCKRVIEAHGGNICFESKEGKGAKFIVKFPIK